MHGYVRTDRFTCTQLPALGMVLWLAFVLAACARPAARGPLSTPSKPATLTQAAPTSPVPFTRTPAASASHTPRPEPSVTPANTADPTAVLGTLQALRSESDVHRLDSPDGKWQAELVTQVCAQVGDDAFIYHRLSLREVSTAEVLVVVEELGPCGLGAPGYELTAWSTDSQSLYYTVRVIPDGAALILPATTYRVSLPGFEVAPLPGSGPLSPDGKHLAWLDGADLVLYDLATGEAQHYPALLPSALPAYLVWQPDGTGLLFVQTEQASYPFGSSTVGLISLPGLEVKILHAGDDPALIALQGFENGGVWMGDDQGRLWFLSIPSGELTEK